MQTSQVPPVKSIHFRDYNGVYIPEKAFHEADKEMPNMPYQEHILMVPDTFEFSTSAVLKLVN